MSKNPDAEAVAATDGTAALTVQVFNPTAEIIDVSVAINVADVVDSTQTFSYTHLTLPTKA